jgi:hypothetical protein
VASARIRAIGRMVICEANSFAVGKWCRGCATTRLRCPLLCQGGKRLSLGKNARKRRLGISYPICYPFHGLC